MREGIWFRESFLPLKLTPDHEKAFLNSQEGFFVCPEGFEPPSAEPESAILSIELWAPFPDWNLLRQIYLFRYQWQGLNIKSEMHDVSILHDIGFSFHSKLSCFLACCFRAQAYKVFVFNNLCTDKSFFEV